MSVTTLVTQLLGLEVDTEDDTSRRFTACLSPVEYRLIKGTEIKVDGLKTVATVTQTDCVNLDGVGVVTRFSAAVTSTHPFAQRTYRMLKGRRFQNISIVADESNVIECLSLISPEAIRDAVKSPIQLTSDNKQPNVAVRNPTTTKRKKIIDEVDRGARTGEHIVYLMFNRVDALLYVGITANGMRRIVQHEREKTWFSEVARIEIERYEELLHAARREKKLIGRFAPLYNVTHNLGRQVLA